MEISPRFQGPTPNLIPKNIYDPQATSYDRVERKKREGGREVGGTEHKRSL